MARTPRTPKPAKGAKTPKAAKPARAKAGVAGTDRMKVVNWERWGDLVKAWTTGQPHRANGKTYAVPRTLDELKKQCKELTIGLKLPKHVTDLVVYSHEKSTMVLRLPPKDLVMASEKELRGRSPYDLPPFYADALGVSGQTPQFGSVEEALDFHARRIGDYTISNCM
jgi:hypothetical protein